MSKMEGDPLQAPYLTFIVIYVAEGNPRAVWELEILIAVPEIHRYYHLLGLKRENDNLPPYLNP